MTAYSPSTDNLFAVAVADDDLRVSSTALRRVRRCA